MPLRVAMLALHTSPLAALGGRETGGMNVYVRHVARELARAGVGVDVFTRRTDAHAPEVVPLDAAEAGGAGEAGARLVHVVAGPAERLEKEALPPLVEEFADGVYAFAQCEGRAYDVVHSHYWLAVEAGALLARRWGVPHVAMFHTLGDVKLRARASEREPAVRLEAERRLVHEVDCIVAATEHERQLLRQLYRVPPAHVRVIPLGVDREQFRPRDRAAARARVAMPESMAADAPVVLAVGRLEPLKGLDILIVALAEMTVRDAQLLIAGGDKRAAAEVARLRAVAAGAGVGERVHFLGAVPHEALPAYYNAADVVAVPSFYESFGLVAVEALASGVPVVASRVGGLTTTVADGRTGYLIPWRCPGPFAEKLDLLLGNAALCAALGRAGAEAMAPFAWPAIAAALRELFAALAAAAE
ncbi:MAG: glycosyltransferase family 1 protein, partial [Chloroflexi bacterium]|nr:glycosyltransferase family 1 protein [Chloroflexota bacterium]